MQLSPLTPSHYPQAEALYEQSFPEIERRDSQKWKQLWLTNDHFFIDVICTNNQSFGGFISYWLFPDFVYIEHFATSPTLRGKGIGGKCLDLFVERFPTLPIILEVEMPTDTTSARRIAFYKRHHFTLLPLPYAQPPYRQEGESLPMHIMCTHPQDVTLRFEQMINNLHREVYEVANQA